MNEGIHHTGSESPNFIRFCKATRFAIACIVLGFSYVSIRCNLDISRFRRIYADMLGESEALPALTLFVFWARHVFLTLSFCVPAACIAFLFTRNIARSLYSIGVLGLVSLLEYNVLWQAVYSPLFRIIEKMQGQAQ